MTTRHHALLTMALLGAVSSPSAAWAQPPVEPPNAPKPQRIYPLPDPPAPRTEKPRAIEPSSTTLNIDLLMSDTTQALQSQTWGRVFDSLGYRVRVRSGGIDDEPKLEETKRGPLRTVQLTGRIDRRGTLTFPGKTFKPGDDKALGQWLEEIEAYGAQGSPVGQPRWGLSTEQFQELFTSLAEEVTLELEGQLLVDAVRSIGFGIDRPLRIHDSVAAQWNNMDAPLVVKQDIRRLSRGSALAVMLNDHGLCVRPLRTPSGSIDLVVQKKSATPDPWPMGWEPRPDAQRSDYAPALFAFGPIGFLERPISETLREAREQTGCAIVVDYPGLAKKEVDLNRRTFGLPEKKTAWVLVLPSALGGTGLVSQIRVDEAGRGFILIAPFEPRSMSTR